MQVPYQQPGHSPNAPHASRSVPSGADPVLKIALAVIAGVLALQVFGLTIAYFAGDKWSEGTWDAVNYTTFGSRVLLFGFAAFAVFRLKVSGGILLAAATFCQILLVIVLMVDEPPQVAMDEKAYMVRALMMSSIYQLLAFLVVLSLTIGISQAVKAVANKSLLWFSIPTLLIFSMARFSRVVVTAMSYSRVFDKPETYRLVHTADHLFSRFADTLVVGFVVAALVMSGTRRA